MAEHAVQASGLTKRYGHFVAVDGIDFAVHRGSCFGFLGPNGAGKTSTLRMIYGRSPATSGSLTVLGLDARTQMRAIKRRIGVVPQENNLDPDFTTRDNLVVYASYYDRPLKEARRRAAELLAFAQLEEMADIPVERLSGGLKRRLVLVRALVNQPELVVLDEPTTGLDPQARHAVWNLLRELKARGVTLLLTTHYMEEAAALCDRLVLMNRGRILAEGAPADLVATYAGAAVLELEGTRLEFDLSVRPEVLRVEAVDGSTLVFTRSLGDAERLVRLLDHGAHRIRPATLEDVFLRLTGRQLGREPVAP